MNILSIISELENEIYCIVKKPPSFPYVSWGMDVDIFCLNMSSFKEKIISAIFSSEFSECKIVIKAQNNYHEHLDLVSEKRLLIRFDLYDALPATNTNILKPSFFNHALARRIDVDGAYFACEIDDLIIRYLEYIQHFAQRPDKIKHVTHILEVLENEATKEEFFAWLHYYLIIPEFDMSKESFSEGLINFYKNCIYTIRSAIMFFQKYGFLKTCGRVYEKLLRNFRY